MHNGTMINPDEPFEPVYDVAVIGAGFSGSLTAVHLVTGADGAHAALNVALVEKEVSAFGRGVAYGTPARGTCSTCPPERWARSPTGSMTFCAGWASTPTRWRTFGSAKPARAPLRHGCSTEGM